MPTETQTVLTSSLRAKQAKPGKAGILAEITHLLRLNEMSTEQIAEIYLQSCLKQGLAMLELAPNAGAGKSRGGDWAGHSETSDVLVKSTATCGNYTMKEF